MSTEKKTTAAQEAQTPAEAVGTVATAARLSRASLRSTPYSWMACPKS